MIAPTGEERLPAVLLVDDDEGLLAVGRAVLAREHEVLTARDGDAALDLLRHPHVGVLLTDLEMPRRDGLDLIRTAHAVRPDVVCILMSGSVELAEIVDAARVPGLHRTLQKPVTPPALRELVAHAADVWLLQRRIDALGTRTAWLLDALRASGRPSTPAPPLASLPLGRAAGSAATLKESVSAYERERIQSALAALHGNKTATARQLGLTYRGLLLKMQRYGMAPTRPRRTR